MATGAGSLFEGKTVDFKEAYTLLDSQEIDVFESIKTLIKDNLDTTHESWLTNSLVDYFYTTRSNRVVDILCSVHDPHDKFLLEKLHDGIKSREEQHVALQLLLHVVSRQPSWIGKVVNMPVLKVVIKCLKSETSVPVLMTAVTIVTILLPSVPNLIGPYLPDIFEIFNRLATLSIKKPVGNTPDIFLLHLQISVYSLFHRLYGMFPYNFLTYLRHFYTKKENTQVFEEVIKNMLERVRLHPKLITGTKDHETSSQRWRQMETHDVIVECARMSLDPVEGTWEELKCPIVASRYMIDRPVTNHNQTQPAVTSVTQSISEVSPSHQSTDTMFWSPSEVIGLSTPPPSQRNTPAIPTLDIPAAAAAAAQYSQQSGAPQFTSIITPSNTPRETPPISEEHEKGISRTSSRYLNTSHVKDPKRLSSEFTASGSVPLLTPSSIPQSVPPSPLKTEFTNTPPVGVKTLPVLYAARELQFDNEHTQSDEQVKINKDVNTTKHDLKVVQTNLLKKIEETSSSKEGSRTPSGTPSRSNSTTRVEDILVSSLDTPVTVTTDAGNQDTVCVENLSQVIDELETNTDDSDEEVSALTSDNTITAESVAKFMRSVNRIRFNSLSTTKSVDLTPKFGSTRSRSCPQLPKIEPTKEEEEVVSRSVSTTCNDEASNLDIEPVEITISSLNPDTTNERQTDPTDRETDFSIMSTGSMVNVNLKQETNITIQTTSSSINVTKCPIYSSSSVTNSHQNRTSEDYNIVELFKQLLNPTALSQCKECAKGENTARVKDPVVGPYFSSFSPPELLDHHIRLGGEIHAKQLSKLPIPSTQLVNWTHFGGVPPADEISILRGQLMLLHNQLLYERNKREQHAKRNRRLLRKIAHTKILEGQNQAMDDQIRKHEMQIRDLNVSLKLLENENRTLKSTRDSEEYEKLVQLKSCLRENELLHCTKRDQTELLDRQKEEKDSLQKKLMISEARLFTAEKELETMKTHSTMNVKLKEQIFQLQKELILKSELLQKNLTNKISKHPKYEFEKLQKALKAELQDMRCQLETKSRILDNCLAQIEEKNKSLENKEITLAELKLSLEKVKSSHDAELKAVEEKNQCILRINQSLESQILQLHTELEEMRSKLLSKERSAMQHSLKVESTDDSLGCSSMELTGSKSPLTRLGSSSSDNFENSQTILAHLQAGSPEFTTYSNVETPSTLRDFESSDQLMILDGVENTLKHETGSLSSESSAFPSMPCTDSEDTRSTSAKSSNLGDSGFG